MDWQKMVWNIYKNWLVWAQCSKLYRNQSIWFAVQIKWLASIWYTTLGRNALTFVYISHQFLSIHYENPTLILYNMPNWTEMGLKEVLTFTIHNFFQICIEKYGCKWNRDTWVYDAPWDIVKGDNND